MHGKAYFIGVYPSFPLLTLRFTSFGSKKKKPVEPWFYLVFTVRPGKTSEFAESQNKDKIGSCTVKGPWSAWTRKCGTRVFDVKSITNVKNSRKPHQNTAKYRAFYQTITVFHRHHE